MYFYREDSKQEWQGKMFTIKLHAEIHGNQKNYKKIKIFCANQKIVSIT